MRKTNTTFCDIPKILLVSHEMTYTGAPRSLLQISKILKEEHYCCDVWTLKRGPFEAEFKNEGFSVEFICFPDSASEKLTLELRKYDLIIANTIFCASFARYAQNYCNVILYLREARNIPELIKNCSLNAEDLKKIEHVLCVSEYAKDFISKEYHLHNLSVLHNFVEDTHPNLKPKKRKKEINLLVSGTIEPRKGQDFALEVYKNLSEIDRKKTKLHFIGNTPLWAEDYKEQLKSDSVEGVIFHGEIKSRHVLLKMYQKADIILIPSKDESCSLVALEAAMLGKAIVLNENIGAKYIVDESCILQPFSLEQWLLRIHELIQNYDLIWQLGHENRKRYEKYGTRENFKRNFIKYIQKTIGIERENSERNRCRVSIIVPVYNAEKYLAKCLKSLVAQTLKSIEFICVNDGSTDTSLKILQEFCEKDSRFLLISTENKGYGHAMNTGIRLASGDYIGIVEPDDYISSDMYELLYHRALLSDADIIKSDFYRFYGEGAEQENIYHQTARQKENYNRIIDPQKEKECFRFIMNTWTGLYRRDFIISNNIMHNETPGASYQDNGFWFKGFCFARKIYFVDKALYYNRRDNPNSSVNNRAKVFCVNEEYKFIREFLHVNAQLEKEFIYQYSMKKYHTYLFNLERIDWKYKKEFLKKFSQEFRFANQNNELSKAVFTPQEWSNLQWIMRDYNNYYENVVKSAIQISVIIPICNAEKYLKQCLESLENQYFQRMEILCIDDGSTDRSREIICSFVNRDKRFQIYTQNNKGAGNARNRGLALAKGKYVLFLDADDYFSPNMLSDSFNKIRESEADICVMNSWQHDMKTGHITPCTYSLQLENLPRFRPFRVEDMTQNPFRCFVGWAWDKLFLKSFLINNDLKFQDLRTSNDMYFTYMALFKADKITTLDARVIYQRRNINESLSMTRDLSWNCFYYALMAMKEELIDMGMYEKRRINFENYALHSCLWNLMTLSEENAYKLLDRLTSGWNLDLGINELDISATEYPEEYKSYTSVLQEPDGLKRCRNEYSEQQVQGMQPENDTIQSQFTSEVDYLRYCIEEIRKSKSYKIGLALTWLPRKIRGW
ncbi:MAG TPA: glycosyltransferase [Candidatus Mediterraneibacter cottocaccae]|nr:glycosyltransferase [Candidatus Mediterraneibacter cottocaccae]